MTGQDKQQVPDQNLQNMRRFQLLVENMQGGIVVEDEQRNIILTNRSFCEIFSIPTPPEALAGSNCSNAVEESKHLMVDPERFTRRIAEIISRRQSVIGEVIHFLDGRVYERDYIPVFTEYQSFIGQMWQYRNITESKQAEEDLKASEARNQALLDALPDSIFLFNKEGLIIDYKAGNKEDLLLAPEAFLNKQLSDTLPPDLVCLNTERLKQVIETGQMQVYEYQLDLDNKLKTFESRLVLCGENNALSIVRDITERKQAEEAIKEREEKYHTLFSLMRLMSDTMPDMLWAKDLDKKYIFANEAICKYLLNAKDTTEPIGKTDQYFADREREAHPDNPDWHTFGELCMDSDAITLKEMKAMQFDEYGNIKGKFVYLDVHKAPLFNDEGDLIGVVGSARDITDRKQAEEKLHEYEKLQQLLMNLATECINVPLEKVDATINNMLEAVGNFTKVDRVYIFNNDYERRVSSNTHEWCAEDITPAIDNLQDFPFEHFIDFLEANQKGEIVNIPDVAKMPANHAMRPVFEAQGIQSMVMLPLFNENVNTGFVGFDAVTQKIFFTEQEINLLKVLAEITSNVLTRQKADKNIRYISFHDQLTGLYNRYYLEEEMVRLNTNRQLPLAVIMADLNGLKLVNDTYGHDTGDKMLIAVATIIRNSCREEDAIARWGGDEFVVLLPQTAAEEARLICKRITESCLNSFVGDIPVSIALGMANKTFMAKDLIETLCEAEDEMYKQKLTVRRSTKSAMVTSLLNTLAAKSFETEEHTKGMQKIAQKIGANLNLTDSELHRLELLITLHDIGKINISENILTKKSSLTDDEWEAIKKHPEIGYRIAMATEEFVHVAEDILAHHERWDGSGYPQGIKEKAIPLLSRITAIADAYEVMSNGRPYKKAMSRSEIIAEFKRCAGTHFDPELVKIILSLLEVDG